MIFDYNINLLVLYCVAMWYEYVFTSNLSFY